MQPAFGAPLLDPIGILTSPQWQPFDPGRIYGIEVNADDCEVRANTVNLANPSHGGIRVTGAEARVDANTVAAGEAAFQDSSLPLGILLAPSFEGANLPHGCAIRRNRLTGPLDAIVVGGLDGMEAEAIVVLGNEIEGVGGRVTNLGVAQKNISGALVSGNFIKGFAYGVVLADGKHNRVRDNRIHDGEAGIFNPVHSPETQVDVSGNVIENMRISGITIRPLEQGTLKDNRIAWCLRTGIQVVGQGHVQVESCEVLDTGISRDGSQVTPSVARGVVISASSCKFESNRVAYSKPGLLDPSKEHRALWLSGSSDELESGHATILGNNFAGLGLSHLVEINGTAETPSPGFEKIMFSNNQCEHEGSPGAPADMVGAATITLWGGHLIVMGNHVKAIPRNIPSLDLNKRPNAVIIGNVTTGSIEQVGSPSVPDPYKPVNAIQI